MNLMCRRAKSKPHPFPWACKKRCWLMLAQALLLVVPVSAAWSQTRNEAAGSPAKSLPHYRNAAPGVKYVGSKTCRRCHTDIYDSFIKTEMGRSVVLPDDPSQLEITREPVTIHARKFNRSFQVFRNGSDLFQREYEVGPDGKEVFRNTQKIEYAIGAGANGYSYFVKRGGLPV